MTRIKRHQRYLSLAALLALPAVADSQASTLTTSYYGTTEDGKKVNLYTMTGARGVTVKFISYGGRLTEILVPDRKGHIDDVVLGFSSLKEYETKDVEGGFHFGALIGRYANRIAGGHFTLDGQQYTLAINNPPNSLHGGNIGFDKLVWDVQPITTSGRSVSAKLSLTSPDGDEGYPGTLHVAVTYTLSDDRALVIDYEATTDKDTVLNLTNHAYFNLAGVGAPDGVYPQVLTINANAYLPTDKTSIPLGPPEPVSKTPFDFRTPTPIGAHIRADNPQILLARGYDHSWVLNKSGDRSSPQVAARAVDPASGRTLLCLTTEPGLQFYTSNFIDGQYAGIGGVYRQTDAFALETQHFPDSPNHPDYPTTELKPGQTFHSTTIFRFGVQQ